MKTNFDCKTTDCRILIDGQPEKPPEPDNYCQTDHGKWVGIVRKFIKSLNYGELVLTVHDSRVVQIEKTEKVRL